MDFVITLCDTPHGQDCPDFGDMAVTAAWPLPDPAKFTGSAGRARGAAERALCQPAPADRDFHSLPFASLDRMALKARLDEIGGGSLPAHQREPLTCASASTAWAASAAWPCAPPWAASIAAPDDPRAGNRLDVVHVNELKGGAATTAHLLEFDSIHGRWRESFGVEDDRAIRHRQPAHRLQRRARRRSDVAWGDLGCDIVLECTGKFLKPEQLQGYFDRGVKQVIVAAPVKEAGALNIVVGVNDHLYEPARASAADRGVLHHQLPRAGGEGAARGDRHPPRPDHDHP